MQNETAEVPGACPVVELRRYTLHSGTRERFIALFDREFVETQEAAGMRIIGQFRDRDAPDTFVWIRGFADMDARKAALTRFYGGPVWSAHGDEANAMMIDWKNVYLLRPARDDAGFRLGADLSRTGDATGAFALAIYHPAPTAVDQFADAYNKQVLPRLAALGATSLATLATETAANTFPRLPVREGENVIVGLLRFDGGHDDAAFRDIARAAADPELKNFLTAAPYISHLTATARSLLR